MGLDAELPRRKWWGGRKCGFSVSNHDKRRPRGADRIGIQVPNDELKVAVILERFAPGGLPDRCAALARRIQQEGVKKCPRQPPHRAREMQLSRTAVDRVERCPMQWNCAGGAKLPGQAESIDDLRAERTDAFPANLVARETMLL